MEKYKVNNVKNDKLRFKEFLDSMDIKYVDKGSILEICNDHVWDCFGASLEIEFSASNEFVHFITTGD